MKTQHGWVFGMALLTALVVTLGAMAAGPDAALCAGDDGTGELLGSGDGQIHIISSLSAVSIKNGDRATVQAVVKAAAGVASVTARIEKEGAYQARESRSGFQPISMRQDVVSMFALPSAGRSVPVFPDFSLHGILNLPVAVLTLQGAPMSLGGVNAVGTIGLWQAEWSASGLEEAFYRVHITVTDRTGHTWTDSSLRFSDPIAGNNTPASTNYPDGGMRRMDSVMFQLSASSLRCAAIDAANGYAYFGAQMSPGYVVKVALGSGTNPPAYIGGLSLSDGEDYLYAAGIDVTNGYVYFGSNTAPGRVVKVATGIGNNPPTRVGAVTLNAGEDYLWSVVLDEANGYAYFGTRTTPGHVVKVALGTGNNPPTRVGAVTLSSGENNLGRGVIDAAAGYAYFCSETIPGRIIKIALGSGNAAPTRIGALVLNSGEDSPFSSVIDPAAGYAYFGTLSHPPKVIKVALGTGSDLPARTGAVTLTSANGHLRSAAIDPAAGYAWFGTGNSPGNIIKVALGAGSNPPVDVGAITLDSSEDDCWTCAADISGGYAYFGTNTTPAGVVKVALGAGANPPTRIGAVTLNSGGNALRCAVIDPASNCAYFGTNTSPGLVVKVALGAGANPPARVGALTLNSDENYLRSAVIDPANGYAYFGTDTVPGRVVKVALGEGTNLPTRAGALALNSGENYLLSAVADPANGYAYFGTNTSPGRVVKVALGTGANPPARVGAVTLSSGENNPYSALIAPAGGYAYFGTNTSPGRVVKVALGAGANPPTRAGALTLNAGESSLYSAVIDPANGYAYFGTGTSPGRVVKVALGAGANPPTRVGAVTLNLAESDLWSSVIDTANGFAYFGTGTYPGVVVKVALGAGANPPTRVGAVIMDPIERALYSTVMDSVAGCAYFGTDTNPGCVVRVALSQKGFLKGTKITVPESGNVQRLSFYSHAAAGNVRLGLYDNSAIPVLLWESPSIPNTAANNWLTLFINNGTPSSLSLQAGTYWLAWQVDTTVSVPSYTAGASGDGFLLPMNYGAFPTTLDPLTNTAPILSTERWSQYLAYGSVYYVDFERPDNSGDGTSWATAKKTIQAAINVASGDDEVWVKAGMYDEPRTESSTGSLVLKSNVALYGGFAGSETERTGRNWISNPTIISGANGRGAGVPAYHTVYAASNSILDGFTIRDGVANGSWMTVYAGGLYVGGATGVRIFNCCFTNNTALMAGALFGDYNSNVMLMNCQFMNNIAQNGGGAIQNQPGAILNITNCLFYNNTSISPTGANGGAIRTHAPATTSITNCTFFGNSTGNPSGGGAIEGACIVKNSILWGNTPYETSSSTYDGSVPTISYSNIQGGYTGTGNINLAPMFINASAYNYRLQSTSPCIDAATAVGAPATDLDGNLRPIDIPGIGGAGADAYDMGAYEYQLWPPSNPGATAIGLDSITWTWQDNSPDEDGFKVYADPGAGEPVTLRVTTAADAESWPYTGLAANTQHAFQVSASNGLGDSAKTANFTAWTLIEPVPGLAFSNVTTTAISVASTNTPSNLASGASGLLFSNTTAGTDSGWQQNTTPWVSSGLTPNTLYSFSGQSRNGVSVATSAAPDTCHTLAAVPLAPVVGNPAGSTLDVAIGAGDGNPPHTEYALYCATGGLWVQGDGTLGASAIWQTAAAWGAKTVSGLAEYAEHAFSATARNGAGVETLAGPSGAAWTLDITLPTGAVAINGGAAYTNTTAVTLALSALDAGSGVADMRFSANGTDWSAWEPFGASKAWTLAAGDGLKTVYAQFRDAAQNVSAAVSAAITLDTIVPTGAVAINGGAAYTNTTAVTLALSALDAGSGVADMRFSANGTDWSAWELFGASKAWTLAAGDGLKTVYAQFRDAAQNVSAAVSAAITLDTIAPVFSGIVADPPEASENETVRISFVVDEALDADPEVTVNTHAAIRDGGKADYAYLYTVLGTDEDPLGPASIQIIGVDLAGNPGAALNTTALTIVEGVGLPLGGAALLALITALCAAGGAASLRRRR